MQITFSATAQDLMFNLDLSEDMTLADMTAAVSMELPNSSTSRFNLYHNGQLLQDQTKTLKDYNIQTNDLIAVHTPAPPVPPRQPAHQQRPRQQPQHGQYDSEMIRLQAIGNPQLRDQLRNSNPELADALNDPDRFRTLLAQMEQQRREAEHEKQREIALLNNDPFNIEAQQKIEELIRQEQVMENLQSALEHHPESFGNVTMLYIPVEVNGIAVKAFVDSGAQATIMSPDCASRCGIMRLIDSRYAGIARGVGTARILGRVHSAQIKIGNLHLPCSFTVMEGKSVDLLLGLDMLKRHQATLDLRKGCLVIQDVSVDFLGESEIPRGFGDAEDETVDGPQGAKISGSTGAVVEPPHQGGGAGFRDIPQAQQAGQASAAAAQQVQQQPTPAPQQQQRQQHSEEAIQQLVSLGFSREEAVGALNATSGNLELAANLLFQ